ncbi:hypothetical protein AMELA_G00265720 [Ameiurus melas]|uniref:SET domain-containing protein n=1 Tax=Ameiurus melas TaxID=219545 RepID=A0A7J5ZQ17_AMEME|nr:hypothetical protein AMELA_G00265720 [Ameiurus melas]
MKPGGTRRRSLRNSPCTPGPSHSQLCKVVKTEETSDETRQSSGGDVDSAGRENGGFRKKAIKKEEPEDEDYFYCEHCRTFFTSECSVHGPAVFVPDTPVPTGVADRAVQTLPPGLEVQTSGIPHAGLGVFNKGETIPIGVHFGPYEGDLVNKEEAVNSGYSWVIHTSKPSDEYIDAKREMHANWMRYVNCARSDDEQNLVAFQYRAAILYRSCRPITPGQELLLSYDEKYAKALGIAFDDIYDKKRSANGNVLFATPSAQCV